MCKMCKKDLAECTGHFEVSWSHYLQRDTDVTRNLKALMYTLLFSKSIQRTERLLRSTKKDDVALSG